MKKRVEEYIKKYTRHCSNELVAVEDKDGKKQCRQADALMPDKKFIRSVHIKKLVGGILYIIVNTSERWVEYQLFRYNPGQGAVQITFYENDTEYTEMFFVSDEFNQFDYQFTSSQEKGQITIVAIPVNMLLPEKMRK